VLGIIMGEAWHICRQCVDTEGVIDHGDVARKETSAPKYQALWIGGFLRTRP
jgi:hypothetical protein